MKPSKSPFRRRLKAKIQAQGKIYLETTRRLDALSGRIAEAYAGMQIEKGLAEIDSIVSQERQASQKANPRSWARRDNGTQEATTGSLYFYSETGTEGGHWAFQKDGTRGYEGMHLLGDGDHLKVFNADGSVRWEGVIWLQSYPPFKESAGNRWIHCDQAGVERQFWAEMFFEELKAELAVNPAGGERSRHE